MTSVDVTKSCLFIINKLIIYILRNKLLYFENFLGVGGGSKHPHPVTPMLRP